MFLHPLQIALRCFSFNQNNQIWIQKPDIPPKTWHHHHAPGFFLEASDCFTNYATTPEGHLAYPDRSDSLRWTNFFPLLVVRHNMISCQLQTIVFMRFTWREGGFWVYESPCGNLYRGLLVFGTQTETGHRDREVTTQFLASRNRQRLFCSFICEVRPV